MKISGEVVVRTELTERSFKQQIPVQRPPTYRFTPAGCGAYTAVSQP